MLRFTVHKSKIIEENKSLRRKNALSVATLLAMTVLTVCSIKSCRKNEAALQNAHQENKKLKESISLYHEDAKNLAIENTDLKDYANEAEVFASSIHPPYPTNRDGLSALDEKEAMKREEEIKKEDAKAMKKWEDSCETIGIDHATLIRLQKGWSRGE